MMQITEEPVRLPDKPVFTVIPGYMPFLAEAQSGYTSSPSVPFPEVRCKRKVVLEQHLGEGCLTGVP